MITEIDLTSNVLNLVFNFYLSDRIGNHFHMIPLLGLNFRYIINLFHLILCIGLYPFFL